MTKRPDLIKVFASQSVQGDYLPVKFGTNITVMKKDYTEIANDNFEFGLESLEKDLQLKDLNSVFFYHGSVLKYLFEQGVPEYSPYQKYELGSVVVSEGTLWIASKSIPAQLKEVKVNTCGPCELKVDKDTSYDKPSKETGWYSFVTHFEYDADMEELRETIKSLQESNTSVKGVTNFKVIPNPLNQALEVSLDLSDGSSLSIPMTNFGKFEEVTEHGVKSFKVTNPDGSIVNLPAHRASVKLINSNGTTIGFTHSESEKEGNFTETVGLVQSDELNTDKGFYWNTSTNRWEVDISNLLKFGSGLQKDEEGNVSIDTSWLQSELDKSKNDALTEVKQYMQDSGSKVFVNGAISGTGEASDPLKLNLGDGLQIVGNKLMLKSASPKVITDVLNQEFKYGLHTFNGLSQNTVGLPENINSEDNEQSKATNPTSSDHYNYNGYYIASSNQLDIWLICGNNCSWKITNESGITVDGSLVNSNGWGNWKKLENSSNLTNTQITSIQSQVNGLGTQISTLQSQFTEIKSGLDRTSQLQTKVNEIDGLTAKISELENKAGKINELETKVSEINQIKNRLDENCKVAVKNVVTNYTIQDSDNVIVVTSTTPVTITLNPGVIPSGRVFTVIQAGTGEITFNNTSGTLIPPYKGGTKTAGQNASVSILFETNNQIRLMGQTKA